MPDLAYSPAAERNREPILQRLQRLLPPQGRALEIALGTGQHVAFFAAAMPQWTWQPTDADAASLAVIAAYANDAGANNILTPVRLDVLAEPWPAFDAKFDAIYCANMLHIAPWPACAALMRGSARNLAPGGVLITYGPYLEDAVPTSPGNLAFDESLRARDPAWGIRRLEDVTREAAKAGLALRERHAMPANNLLLVWSAQA
jgi:SAM-dependent methyltransferase